MPTRAKKIPVSPSDNKVLVRYRSSDMVGVDKQDIFQIPLTSAIVVGDASDSQKKGHMTGVYGHSDQSIAIYGVSPVYAGWFDGDVHVVGNLTQEAGLASFANVTVAEDITMVNADCAEDFDVSGTEKVEPGTVMVLGDEGLLLASERAYDRRVAGVVSGAGDYKPGIVLDKQATVRNRQPIALMGKVFCKVDAQFGAIGVGDLLTTSPTAGHAMKTTDPLKSFGAVIGKALRPLLAGQGLIPIMVALQ
jgi:hypothetical protein